MITSDHSPWDIAKRSCPDDIFANASGIPGVQTAAVIRLDEELAP